MGSGNLVYHIRCHADVEKMQLELNKLGVPSDKKFIALEFAENMVESCENGEIIINGIQVVSVVENDPEKASDARKHVEAAKFLKDNRIDQKVDGSHGGDEKYGGRGLLSILFSGWNLDVLEEREKRRFSIVATRQAS